MSESTGRALTGTTRHVGNAWSPVAQVRREAPLAEGENVIAETRAAQAGHRPGTRRLGLVRLTDRRLTALFNAGGRGNKLTDVPRQAVLDIEDRGDHLAVRYRAANGEEALEFGAGNRPQLFTRWWHSVAPLLRSDPGANHAWLELIASWVASR